MAWKVACGAARRALLGWIGASTCGRLIDWRVTSPLFLGGERGLRAIFGRRRFTAALGREPFDLF
jgi:hypothetical protein